MYKTLAPNPPSSLGNCVLTASCILQVVRVQEAGFMEHGHTTLTACIAAATTSCAVLACQAVRSAKHTPTQIYAPDLRLAHTRHTNCMRINKPHTSDQPAGCGWWASVQADETVSGSMCKHPKALLLRERHLQNSVTVPHATPAPPSKASKPADPVGMPRGWLPPRLPCWARSSEAVIAPADVSDRAAVRKQAQLWLCC